MNSLIVPDKPGIGNVFKISSEWTVNPESPDRCKLEIKGEAECKKSIWGVTGTLTKQVLTYEYQQW